MLLLHIQTPVFHQIRSGPVVWWLWSIGKLVLDCAEVLVVLVCLLPKMVPVASPSKEMAAAVVLAPSLATIHCLEFV